MVDKCMRTRLFSVLTDLRWSGPILDIRVYTQEDQHQLDWEMVRGSVW